jgi:hypothetical protein
MRVVSYFQKFNSFIIIDKVAHNRMVNAYEFEDVLIIDHKLLWTVSVHA